METKQTFAENARDREREGSVGWQGGSEVTILRGGIDYLSSGGGGRRRLEPGSDRKSVV